MSDDRPLRVLHVVQGYAPATGGTERVIQRISEELVSRFGDEVTVFCGDGHGAESFVHPDHPRLPAETETRAGVVVRRFRVLRSMGPWLGPLQNAAFRMNLPLNQYLRSWYAGPIIPGLTAAIRDQPADVVVASSFPLRHMYQALRGARRAGHPSVLIGGLHPGDRWGYERSMIHRAIGRCGRYIAYTDYEKRHVVERGADPSRVDVIALGVDPEPFGAADPLRVRRALGLEDAPVVGFVGQLGVHKGLDTLLEAMPSVWSARPRTRLLIAGARTEFSSRIEERIASFPPDLRGKVVLRYDFSEEEKPDLFAALDVFAYPSGYESFGVAFLEAWAAGKPVVGCSSGAVEDVVRDGEDGLLVPYRDADALAKALLDLVHAPLRAKTLGRAGRERVARLHAWPAVAGQFREAYRRAIA